MGEPLRLSVCIVTYERPDFLRRCLEALEGELDERAEVVVVDASALDRRRSVREIAPAVRYVHAPDLAGWMTRSRNEALRWARGEVIAFLDDDVVVHSGWQTALFEAFDDPTVAAVAGRTCNGVAGEDHYGGRPIGRLLPDGTLTDGFASAPDGDVDVDHGIGANMAFRRDVLADLGGFRDDYPGTALREDTDVFLRVRALGGRSVFAPAVVVDHLPAPHVHGARFDTRYKLYGRRNHMVLLARDRGIRSAMLRRWMLGQLKGVGRAPGSLAKARRLAVTLVGLGWGTAAVLGSARWNPLPAPRTDRVGNELRRRLEREAS